MIKSITKVTLKTKKKANVMVGSGTGLNSVLTDIENDIRTLKEHRDIVGRKIKSGERGIEAYRILCVTM